MSTPNNKTTAIRLVRHAPAWRAAVRRYNERVTTRGGWGLYESPDCQWLPMRAGAASWREFYLAVDQNEQVRGGFALRQQTWIVRGQEIRVADFQGPISEGVVDPRFAPLAIRMLREMQRLQPMLYGWGFGGRDTPLTRILVASGWRLAPFPLSIYVNRPRRFLEQIGRNRGSAWHRAGLRALAKFGPGNVLFAGHRLFTKLLHSVSPAHCEAEAFTKFGDWADELWLNCRPLYAALSVRDARTMNQALPDNGWLKAVKLCVRFNGHPIGWAVVLDTQFSNDDRFGALRIGSIVDCLARPEHAASVARAATRLLLERGVDAVVSNQTHPAWINALSASGYITLRRSRTLAVSPALEQRLGAWDETRMGLHVTNLDGHGPHGL